MVILLVIGYVVYATYAKISPTGSTANAEDKNTDSNSDADTIPEENNAERYATITIVDDNVSV